MYIMVLQWSVLVQHKYYSLGRYDYKRTLVYHGITVKD